MRVSKCILSQRCSKTVTKWWFKCLLFFLNALTLKYMMFQFHFAFLHFISFDFHFHFAINVALGMQKCTFKYRYTLPFYILHFHFAYYIENIILLPYKWSCHESKWAMYKTFKMWNSCTFLVELKLHNLPFKIYSPVVSHFWSPLYY